MRLTMRGKVIVALIWALTLYLLWGHVVVHTGPWEW